MILTAPVCRTQPQSVSHTCKKTRANVCFLDVDLDLDATGAAGSSKDSNYNNFARVQGFSGSPQGQAFRSAAPVKNKQNTSTKEKRNKILYINYPYIWHAAIPQKTP